MPRALPPQVEGWPPSDIVDQRKPIKRLRRRIAAPTGRPTNADIDRTAAAVISAVLAGPEPDVIALAKQVHHKPETIKALIKTARQTLQSRAVEYANLHVEAARVAATTGDAKPAQWALERIAEGDQRIVDRDTDTAPGLSLNVGIALGGLPPPSTPITIHELPVLAPDPTTDTP